jgi:hypothetical protein
MCPENPEIIWLWCWFGGLGLAVGGLAAGRPSFATNTSHLPHASFLNVTSLICLRLHFFRSSKLDDATLMTIWEKCDLDLPAGVLAEVEFYEACKMVGLEQAAKVDAKVADKLEGGNHRQLLSLKVPYVTVSVQV